MIIFLTGGGSGGHILPNLALLPNLLKHNVTIRYIGERHGMEEELIKKSGIPFHGIVAGKLRRYFSLRNLWDVLKIPVGILSALFPLIRYRPRVIFSKGGYVALPVCIAAWILRIPIVIHDSDVHPGLTTKLTAKLASHICVSWQETLRYFPTAHLTGVPVREEITNGNKKNATAFLQVEENDLPTLLVIGGSLGAKGLNEFIAENSDVLLAKMNIIHITGNQGGNSIKIIQTAQTGWYRTYPFLLTELSNIYAYADVILSRAGATALAEYAAIGKPCILVPLPTTASRGDQLDNAKAMEAMYPEMIRVTPQDTLDSTKVQTYVQELLAVHADTTDNNTAVEKITKLLLSYQ